MEAVQGPVVVPVTEIAVDRAAGREVLRQRTPLAARAQDEHQPIDDLALINCPLVAATLGRRDKRTDQRPLLIRQIAGVAQLAAVVTGAVLHRPHAKAPANRLAGQRITTDSYDSS